MAISEELKAEARAFDARMDERFRHGHVPDLRRLQPCDWFFNNPWRRPCLVEMDCGRAFRFALSHARPGRLLEVGCGQGHMSLEFARNGFHVVGLDISPLCLEIAKRVLADNPFRDGFGSLRYVNDDFLSWEVPVESFETVCFFGSLHHFENPYRVLDKVAKLLVRGGRVLVLEPARDWITDTNAAVVVLIRLLLGVQRLWYDPLPLPKTEEELQRLIADCLIELQEGRDILEPQQSPHDNASGAEGMLVALHQRFRELECRRVNGFMQRVVGGVRGGSEEQSRSLAEFLDIFDRVGIKIGLIQAGELYWAGEKE